MLWSFLAFTHGFESAGFFCAKELLHDFKAAIKSRHLTILTGIVVSGKTMLARQVREELVREGEMLLCTSLAVEKDRVTLGTLMIAPLLDLGIVKIPRSREDREPKLRDVIRGRGRPVALFVDEAHDLRIKTLIESKRLLEIGREEGVQLSIVLVGQPKIKANLERLEIRDRGSRQILRRSEAY